MSVIVVALPVLSLQTGLMEGSMKHTGEKAPPMPGPSPSTAPSSQMASERPSTAPTPTVAGSLGAGATVQGATVPVQTEEPSSTAGAGGAIQSREEYGYIVTNQRYVLPLTLSLPFDPLTPQP